MIDARFRPTDKWPGKRTPPHQRQAARFRASYPQTLSLLEAELHHLRAKEIVIEAGFRLEDIRNDGWPRSSARKPSDSGVIVSFKSPSGPLSFPCDRYGDWEDNLRAIALSLQALRAVDRYGVTQHAEQYKGWTALPAPPPSGGTMTREDAAQFIGLHSGLIISATNTDVDAMDAAYKLAARKLHPDAGGNHEMFVRLQAARKALGGANV